MKTLCAILGALVCCASAVPLSIAAPIEGDGTLGDFTGDFSYNYEDSGTEATLNLWLSNTSPDTNGGYLTAFVFNIPSGFVSDVTFYSSDGDFGLLRGPDFSDGLKAVPYGYFDIGAGITDQFLGGGKPSPGIPAGDSETFTFCFTGTNLNRLTVQSFVNETSVSASSGQGSQFFVARFRGFEDGGSNKTVGCVVPIPGAAWLLGSGLVGLVGLRKRFNK
jgi:hypothetical protein